MKFLRDIKDNYIYIKWRLFYILNIKFGFYNSKYEEKISNYLKSNKAPKKILQDELFVYVFWFPIIRYQSHLTEDFFRTYHDNADHKSGWATVLHHHGHKFSEEFVNEFYDEFDKKSLIKYCQHLDFIEQQAIAYL